MSTESARVVPLVIAQHVEDAAFLYAVRTALVGAPHIKFGELVTFDGRIAAQIDALMIAGNAGWPFCAASLESPTAGAVFTATVRALQDFESPRLLGLLALAEASPPVRPGLLSGFGWVD